MRAAGLLLGLVGALGMALGAVTLAWSRWFVRGGGA